MLDKAIADVKPMTVTADREPDITGFHVQSFMPSNHFCTAVEAQDGLSSAREWLLASAKY